MNAKTWWVIAPDRTAYSYGEPPDPYCPVALVEAETRREARIEAVRVFRKQGELEPGENPFYGLKVEDAACRHGVYPEAPSEKYVCPACDDEWASYDHARDLAWAAGLDEV